MTDDREMFAPLFEPIDFGRTRLRNRVVMAPMTRHHSPGGIPGADVAAYYHRRAVGGAGLIITEGAYIDHPASNGYNNVPAFFGAALSGWRHVVEAVHAAGGAIVPQLWHVGSVRRPGTEPDPAALGVGPGAIHEEGRQVVRAMTEKDIAEVVASYARAARSAAETGFDGVEIHGAHGYLLDQFIWHGSNDRDDKYGGPVENRVRFATEVVAAIRVAVPSDFPVIFRFSQWKINDYGAHIAEDEKGLAAILLPLRDAGVDIFHASTRRFWEPAFEGSPDTLAAVTRKLTGRPVIAVGSAGLEQPHQARNRRTADNMRSAIGNLDRVLKGFVQGDFDLIAVGRGMLADPAWASKVQAGNSAALTPMESQMLEILT